VHAFVPSLAARHEYCNEVKAHRKDATTFLYATLDATVTTTTAPSASTTTPWFPTRIQETVQYESTVSRLYVRHIVTETRDMAEAALHQYRTWQRMPSFSHTTTITTTTDDDPFARVARSLSACAATRDEGGRIGWIDRHAQYEILPAEVVLALFTRQPKAGDVCILHCPSKDVWHVVQVMELWVTLPPQSATTLARPERIGGHAGVHTVTPRRTLPGSGLAPPIPTLPSLSTYAIHTAGCQMNVADSERLAGILHHQLQLAPAATNDKADVVIFHTCSIRDHAEQKLYDALGPYAACKRRNKAMVLLVTGCVAQQQGEALLRRVPEIDGVLGPQYLPFLPSVLDQIAQGYQVVATAPLLIPEQSNGHPPLRGHDVRAWVNVIYGCNEHCTYCVVPGTRGMEQSRTMEAIVEECQALAAQGYKEVTLLGQNIDAYGRDMVPKRTFADLLETLNANLPDNMRIRYVTSHPRYFSDRVIDAVAHLDKVCECFHMPFQAGDDDVLKAMRRGYTYDSYMKIIHKIRAQAPDAAICADVIVGFPGETEEAFQKTLQLMEEVQFDNLNSFMYSPRPNTEAALWTNQVPEDVKAERLQRVQALAAHHGLARSQRYLGRTVEVLVEDGNPRNSLQVMGRTRQGRQAYFDGDLSLLRGQLVNVKITEARTWSLMGEAVGE
jgi:tRNA-2-methylthio-N6-dimethylallyladenosine synthase